MRFDGHGPRGRWRRRHRGCAKRRRGRRKRRGKRQSVEFRRRCGKRPGVGCWERTRRMPTRRRMGILCLRMPWTATTGDQRCRGCVSRKTACLVDEARVKKWKQLVAEGTVLTRVPPGVVCSKCASKKHKCFLPELERERATMKPAVKQKREEEDEPRASGSKEATGAAGEGAEEAPKKKVK